MNKFRTSKRLGQLAFPLSCLFHIAALALIVFLTRKAFEQWPSMGPQAGRLGIMQIELQAVAASSPEPAKPSGNSPPPPERAEIPLEEIQKPPEPEPEPAPRPEAVPPAVVQGEAVSAEAQTAQVSQAPGALADVEAAELLAGQGRAGEIGWQMLAVARLRAMVEREKYYPAAAKNAGYTGWCRVRVHLAPDGTVSGYEVEKRHGHPLLGRAVEATMGNIRGRNIGIELPQSLDVPLTIEFELN